MARSARLVAVSAAVLVAAGAAVARVSCSGRSDLEVATMAEAAGLRETAADYYGRAARWYLPLSAVQGEALAALARMGTSAEGAGDRAFALRCFGEVRSAILGTRWLATPQPSRLAEANSAIARLMAAEDRELRGEQALSEAGHLELLERDLSPDPGVSLLSVVLFVAWIGVLVRGGLRGVEADGRVHWRVLGGHLAVSLALLACWLAAVRMA